MEAISAWVRGIVVLVLAVTFLEMLVPRSGLKKFVDMVMGLAVIAGIIAPLVNIGMGYVDGKLAESDRFAMSGNLGSFENLGTLGEPHGLDGQQIAAELTETVIEAKVREALAARFYGKNCFWEVRASIDRSGALLGIEVNVSFGGAAEGCARPGDSEIAAAASAALGVDPEMIIVRQVGRR
ncbi:MAG TPA: stage III sporulation protein AF [Bacillota bacterium]|nr:stage III sporulation protein AF [Bacillota bacterium]HOL50757.1 stage III sporulation protein AF [Bacillota bacterium]